ncbi:MAG: CoA transferase, partial [Gammaproteobacteria bacterium]|nr:CoA transferase [Gammaproteobacteria bacterium]
VLGDENLANDERFVTVSKRVENRPALDEIIIKVFSNFDQQGLMELLLNNNIACGRLNLPADVLDHPQLRTVTVNSSHGPIELTASGVVLDNDPPVSLPVPALGEHTDRIKAEFADN